MRDLCVLITVVSCVAACSPPCNRRDEVLATDTSGRSIVWTRDCSTSESIEFKSPSGRKTTIIKYESSGGVVGCNGRTFSRATEISPAVTWHDPSVVHISNGIIHSIDQKLDEVDGVHVSYDVGTVLTEVCPQTAG